jgi:ActR/RegA family two-component response regulator
MNQMMRQLRSGEAPVENPRAVDLASIARRVQILRAAGNRAVQIDARDGIVALGHEERLERVIGHLVQNALDAAGEHGRVTVRVGRDGEEAVVEVSDNGPGMSSEFLRERLFKPFETTKATGMGIGAYESDQYVRGVGGRITVDSELGKGTTVRVMLRAVPQSGGGANSCAERGRSAHRPSRRTKRSRARFMSEARKPLLVVEDDPALQTQMKWAFDAYDVALASDRASALSQVRRLEPAVVTMDLGLPPAPDDPSEGFRTLQEILEIAPETKVIVLTGQNDRANALQAVALGAYDFYAKPFESEVLTLMIERAFRMHELQQENRRLQASIQATRSTACSRTIRRCCGFVARSRRWRRPTPRCCCWANRAPARNCSRAACTTCRRGARSGWLQSTVRRSPTRCSKANSSATSAVRSPVPRGRRSARSKRHTVARFFSTRSAICRWRCSRNCCAFCRSV